MRCIKDFFRYMQQVYPNNLEEIKTGKTIQRRLMDDDMPERLNEILNQSLEFENINIKVKLGPSYNRSLNPWIQLYTDENYKGTKGHYAGLSFEKEGYVSAWLGFGRSFMKKLEIIETRNKYIREYAEIENELKHGFKYNQVFIEAVIISKTYKIKGFSEEEFYSDMEYLIDLYKKHEAIKKFGDLYNNTEKNIIEVKEEIKEIKEENEIKKGVNKLYRGYTEKGKTEKILQEYLYKKDENGNEKIINSSQYEKVVFYPEYKKEDFIVKIEPTLSQYIAGSFCRILKKALNYQHTNFYLIIEQFNKANIYEIFGNTINLLERREDGRSKYEIFDQIIGTYLYGKENCMKPIYIPQNLIILAINDENERKIDSYIAEKFETEWIEISNENLDNYYVKGLKDIKWGTLRNAINEQISENLNRVYTESDKIDSYFLSKDMITDIKNTEDMIDAREKLTQKLFINLYEKVCMYRTEMIFSKKIESIEDLIRIFKGKNYLDIFEEKIKVKLEK